MPFLRQSTAQAIRFGPCLDKDDGVTEETGLTLAQADMRLSKDGGAFAQKSAAGNATHDSDGWYSTTLSTTDTNTVGELILNVHQPANMLPVWLRWWILEEAVYDAMYGASAAGPLQSTVAARTLDVTAGGATGIDWGNVENPTTAVDLSATDIQLADTVTTLTGHTAQTGDSFARIGVAGAGLTNINLPNQTMDIVGNITGNLSGSVGSVTGHTAQTGDTFALANGASGFVAIKGDTAAILIDTNELQADWTNAGRLDTILDTIAADVVNIDGAAMRGTDSALLAASAPTNFGDLSITLTTGLVDITQAAADKVWGTAARVLTAGTNIVLAKGVGVTGFNDIAATDMVSSGAITTLAGAVVNVDLVDTLTTYTGNTVQTGDSFARIGAAGAGLTNIDLPNQTMDIVGDITGNLSGSVGSVTGAVGSVTARVTANTDQIAGVAAAATGLSLSADTIVNGTASGTPTTTTMVSDVSITVDDQLNGRIIIFADNTTTAALRDQATDITACTAASNTLTFTALTTAPVSGDTFVIV